MKWFIFVLVIYFPILSFCQRPVMKGQDLVKIDKFVPNLFYTWVHNIEFENGRGSATEYIASDSTLYYITAAHLFKKRYKRKINSSQYKFFDSVPFKSGNVLKLSIFSKGKWQENSYPVLFHKNKNVDIAMVKVGLSSEGSNQRYFSEMFRILSQDCFIAGYPQNLSLKVRKNPEYSHDFPLLAKGTLASQEDKDNLGITYVSGQNTHGYSGGPLLAFDYTENEWRILGVICGYLKQKNTVDLENGKTLVYYENSGIMICHSIRHVKEIIEQSKVEN